MAVHGRMQKFTPQGSKLNLSHIMPAKRQSQPKRPTRRLDEHWQPKLILKNLNKQLIGKRSILTKDHWSFWTNPTSSNLGRCHYYRARGHLGHECKIQQLEKIRDLNEQLCNLGRRQQANYMMFNPPFEEDCKKTLTSWDELKNSKGLERYLAKLSTIFSWYFDFGATMDVIGNSDLLVFLKKWPHINTITIVARESHHVVGEGNMIAKFKIGDKTYI